MAAALAFRLLEQCRCNCLNRRSKLGDPRFDGTPEAHATHVIDGRHLTGRPAVSGSVVICCTHFSKSQKQKINIHVRVNHGHVRFTIASHVSPAPSTVYIENDDRIYVVRKGTTSAREALTISSRSSSLGWTLIGLADSLLEELPQQQKDWGLEIYKRLLFLLSSRVRNERAR